MANFGPLAAEIVSRIGSITTRHSASGHQPNFAVLNRDRHLYSAGWPSHWALAHILVALCLLQTDAFSALTLLVGWQEEHPACKTLEW